LLGSEVDEVFSFSRPSPYYEDETVVTTACLSDGALATGVFTLKTSPTNEVEIYGEHGRLNLSLYRFDGFDFFSHATYPGSITDRLKKSVFTLLNVPRMIPTIRRGGDFAATFHGLWQHFLDCVDRNQVPECGLEDGKRALQISLGAIESLSAGRPVQIKS
jgi:predicted dehydrogenase